MRVFEVPTADVKMFEMTDILTTSSQQPSSEPCPENTITPCFDD